VASRLGPRLARTPYELPCLEGSHSLRDVRLCASSQSLRVSDHSANSKSRHRPPRHRRVPLGAVRSTLGGLVGGVAESVSAVEPVKYPHNLAAPAARAGGHRVCPPGQLAPRDLSARLADEFRHRRHVERSTRVSSETVVVQPLRILSRIRLCNEPSSKRGSRLPPEGQARTRFRHRPDSRIRSPSVSRVPTATCWCSSHVTPPSPRVAGRG
jgi:hypothetical protein